MLRFETATFSATYGTTAEDDTVMLVERFGEDVLAKVAALVAEEA